MIINKPNNHYINIIFMLHTVCMECARTKLREVRPPFSGDILENVTPS